MTSAIFRAAVDLLHRAQSIHSKSFITHDLQWKNLKAEQPSLHNAYFQCILLSSFKLVWFNISVECLAEVLGQSTMFSTLLPTCVAYIGPVATMDPRVNYYVFAVNAYFYEPLW